MTAPENVERPERVDLSRTAIQGFSALRGR